MPITRSAASEIRALVESLGSADDIRREAAIARLAVIGSRAVDRLIAAYKDGGSSSATRIGILRALEAIGDPRSIPVARQALQEGGDIAAIATSTLRALLDSPVAGAATASLDLLVATALDRGLERRVRLAAFDALQEMPADVRAGLARALEGDPDTAVTGRLAHAPRDAAAADAVWQDALDGRLPDSPSALRDAAQTRAPSAALSSMQKLVDAVRAREEADAGAARVQEWLAVRGALHQALALRGSRIALYDLRETVAAAASPLPATFLAALHVVGDESCLHPIAAAHARAAGDARWQHQLEAAFKAIVKREKLGRKAVAKLLQKSAKRRVERL